jgi:hypothetical protein
MQFFITWFKRQRHIWTYSLRSLRYVKGYLPLLSLQTRRVLLLMERAKKDSSLFGLMAQFSLVLLFFWTVIFSHPFGLLLFVSPYLCLAAIYTKAKVYPLFLFFTVLGWNARVVCHSAKEGHKKAHFLGVKNLYSTRILFSERYIFRRLIYLSSFKRKKKD